MFYRQKRKRREIHLLYHHDEEILHRMRKRESFVCIACGKKVLMRLGKQKKLAFCS
ncbi:competence protein CoiA family protein [Bacillus pacificus]